MKHKSKEQCFLIEKIKELLKQYKLLSPKMRLIIGVRILLWIIILAISFYGAIKIVTK